MHIHREYHFTLFLIVTLFLFGCGATQLYDGPRLPREQVVRVRSEGSKLTFDGKATKSIWDKEVELLPGEHVVECQNSIAETPHSCRSYTSFNSYSHDECMSDRDKEIGKNGSSVKTCNYCEFEETKQKCTVPKYYTKCTSKVNLIPGGTNLIDCRLEKNYMKEKSTDIPYSYDGHMTIDAKETGSCTTDGPIELEEEFSCGSGCGYHVCSY